MRCQSPRQSTLSLGNRSSHLKNTLYGMTLVMYNVLILAAHYIALSDLMMCRPSSMIERGTISHREVDIRTPDDVRSRINKMHRKLARRLGDKLDSQYPQLTIDEIEEYHCKRWIVCMPTEIDDRFRMTTGRVFAVSETSEPLETFGERVAEIRHMYPRIGFFILFAGDYTDREY